MSKKFYTIKEAAELLSVCYQRVQAKIRANHFPNIERCPCGHGYLIPASDIRNDKKLRPRGRGGRS